MNARQPHHRNKSTSYQKHTSRSHHSSAIYQTGRNSLFSATPKIIDKQNSKYQTYIQFITNDKIMPCRPHKNIYVLPKKAITPNPKRPSPNLMKGRKSVYERGYQPANSNERQSVVSPKVGFQKDLNLQVKGKLIRNKVESKKAEKVEKIIKKVIPIQKGKKSKDKKHLLDEEESIDIEQEKLVNKLFKGRGAHALVRSAVDWNKKRKIAVKVYQKSQLSEQQLKSIQREIQILLNLNHVNIVKLYEIIETYKTINLMMEYGGGNSLEQYIRSRQNGKLNQQQAKSIFKQILRAVDFMHTNNIAHRDLKTQNILLNKHLQLKIIDFGFSLRCFPDKTISSYCGTPTYMAPEVVNKNPHNPIYSDRWSLGILLYTMMNGQCPFKASTQKQLFKKISDGMYTYIANVSNDAKFLIQSFLRKNPKERISANEGLNSKWMMNAL